MDKIEQNVLDGLMVAWNNFVKLKSTHPDDLNDFRRSLHECERIIGMRQLRKIDPDRWITLENVDE